MQHGGLGRSEFDTAAPSLPGLKFRLSAMMFLEFFIWGSWFPLIPIYLGLLQFGDAEKAWILNTFALGSFTAMFFSTQFADRNFAAEKFLAFSQLVGGLAILAVGWVTAFWPIFLLMLVHCLFYVPTISITNSIAFTHLKDAQRDFGLVRLWGTIGWIAASWPFIFILADWSKVPAFGTVPFTDWLGTMLGTPKTGEEYKQALTYIFITAGIASLLLAALSLVLPHTPPRPAQAGGERFAWLEAMQLLRYPFLLVLFVVTFVDAAVHAGYFYYTGKFLETIGVPSNWVMPAMSIGQIAEILTMAILGYCLKALGWRTTMVVGILGHALRFGVYAWFPEPEPAVAINVVHGICYAFFFATVYIFVDEFFPKDARSSAQGLFNFMILGLGPFVGIFIWPNLESYFTTEQIIRGQAAKVVDYQSLFLVPAGIALAAALALLLFFHPPTKAKVPEVESALAEPSVQPSVE